MKTRRILSPEANKRMADAKQTGGWVLIHVDELGNLLNYTAELEASIVRIREAFDSGPKKS